MPLTPPPKSLLNQTELDHQELDSTVVSPALAKGFSWAFALLLLAVPLSQATLDLMQRKTPQAFSLFQPFGRGMGQFAGGQWKQALETWRAAIRPETLHSYEATLESNSVWKQFFQPRIQEVLSGPLGYGNDKVVLGRDGWLFYQHGLEYVVHQSITDPSTLEQTAKATVDKAMDASPHPDPRPAILELDRECRKAGIHLVVLPIPDKAMLQPTQLGEQKLGERNNVRNNEGYAGLMRQMREAGVDWFDVTPASIAPGDVRYLVQDTHWAPSFMDTVASALASHIKESGVLPAAAAVSMRTVETNVTRVGDLVDMLKLPLGQALFAPQTVLVHKILDAQGQPVQPDPQANVLLLGDSFTNIYSLRDLGWGTGAGFGEHLAYHLKQRIDVIAFNGGGPVLTRTELARQENAARLGFKKVIVYEFAIRDLLGENWKPIAMVKPVPPPVLPIVLTVKDVPAQDVPAKDAQKKEVPPSVEPTRVVAPADNQLTVIATIVQTSKVPVPGSAPYKDCLTFIKVKVQTVESGNYAKPEMLVAFLAMENDKLLPPASYAVGDRLRLMLIPLAEAETRIRSLQRADDTDDFTLRPYYVIRENRL
jgi:hypothetical protein